MGYEKVVRVMSGGTVHITDSSARAAALIAQGEAVLAYLHAGNRREDFGCCRYACEDPEELDEAYLDKVYLRQKGLPVTVLQTARCLVRETTVADVADFYEIYADPSVTRYMEPLYDDPDAERAYAAEYIENVYAYYDFGIWTVVERASGQVIGRAGICYREGFADPELGFLIGVPWQGQGLATEVCEAILEYASEELGFATVLAFVQPENAVSQRVCEKLGMRGNRTEVVQGVTYDIYTWQAQ